MKVFKYSRFVHVSDNEKIPKTVQDDYKQLNKINIL